MIANTKLILCGILALIIGIASVIPVAFYMYEESNKPRVDVEAILGDQPPLNFNLTYAYIGDYWNNNSNINDGNYGWKYHINYRTVPIIGVNDFPIRQSFAAYEYYTLEVSTEKGVIATLAFDSHVYSLTYLDYNSSTDLSFGSQQWFTCNSTNRMRSASNSQQGPEMNNSNGTAYGQVMGSASDWDISAGKPETIFLTIRLLGWVIINDNGTTVHYASSEPIAQVQLQNYGGGFMYNKLFTEDELAQINPVMPQFKFYLR
jgi:hypothetical protein